MHVARINLYLLTLTPLHVGGGEGRYGYEQTIVTRRVNGVDTPYIPGSTVKGVLRTSACYASELIGAKCCWAKEPSEIMRVHSKHGVCDVCRIWGMPGKPGTLYVTDFKPLDDILTSRTVVRTTHVEIDDATGRVREAAFYVMDYVAVGTVFEGLVELEFKKPLDLALLLSATYLTEYIGLGRAGIVRPYIASFEINGSEIHEPEQLLRLLKSITGGATEMVKLISGIYQEMLLPPKLDIVSELSKPRVWRW